MIQDESIYDSRYDSRRRAYPPHLSNRSDARPVNTVLICLGAAFYVITVLFLLFVSNAGPRNPNFPNFQVQINQLFFGLAQCLLFGWFYGVVVFIWQRTGINYAFCYFIEENNANKAVKITELSSPTEMIGALPFLPSRRERDKPHHARRVFLLAAYLSIAMFACLVGYVIFTHAGTAASSHVFPGSLFGIAALVIGAAFLLFPCLPPYAATRLSLSAVLGQVLLAPLWGVHFVHVIVADAMTSASLTLYQVEESICFVATGAFLYDGEELPQSADRCGGASLHNYIMQPIMYALPFWIRFVQCWMRFWETRKEGGWAHWQHAVNAGKYSSALFVIAFSTAHNVFGYRDRQKWDVTKWLWLLSIVVKTLYCAVWDIYMDWGLGRIPQPSAAMGNGSLSSHHSDEHAPLLLSHDPLYGGADVDLEPTSPAGSAPTSTVSLHSVSNHRSHSSATLDAAARPPATSGAFPFFLREHRLYRHTWFYYFAIVTNFIMRCSWSVALGGSSFLPRAWAPITAMVEILRRAQWKIIRMEQELLNKRKKQ